MTKRSSRSTVRGWGLGDRAREIEQSEAYREFAAWVEDTRPQKSSGGRRPSRPDPPRRKLSREQLRELKRVRKIRDRRQRYQAYLKTAAWAELRRRVIERDGGKCVDCGGPGSEVHHRTYHRLMRERLSDLELLCAVCHQKPEKHPWKAEWRNLYGLSTPRRDL